MTMQRQLRLALSAAACAAMCAGCSDWLSGPQLTKNPNAPSTAGRDQLLTAVGAGQTVFQTGDLARTFSTWMQQMAGTDRQFIPISLYQYTEDNFSPDWIEVYDAGGLIDERALEKDALAAGDSAYAGVGMVWEALTMGTAADVWGDIPYSQAVSDVLQPALDPQQQVFAEVQAKLDTALAYLGCKSVSCTGPSPTVDLWYGDSLADWAELAHTLKARFYLHTATQDPSAYALALAQADSGISTPAHDLLSWQSSNPNEWNLWYQFMVIDRSGYISAGQFLVNLLQSTNDPRLPLYFSPNGGVFAGAPPGGGSGTFSTLSAIRLDPAFRQPMVTYAENQLIIAEAALQTGQQSIADAAYNAERASQGVPGKSGVTLQDIITEKYIALFQQIEPWNDYKRTCLPAITPAQPTGVPGRLLYPSSAERNANKNVPPPDQQPPRNWDQPNACPG